MSAPAPLDDLYRGRVDSIELRDAGETSGTMFGHFTVFDTWYEIDSWYEGQFLERVAPGAVTKTIREHRDSVVVQFDHGYDMHIGDAPLGVIEDLRADDVGAYYEVALLDTDYVRDRVLPMLQGRTLDGRTLGSVLGASFRFRVTKEEWVNPTKATAHNPDKLPERTIRELRLYEFGPVVFPANPAAVADRSLHRPQGREDRCS
jgi:HK97 family phage prohead protease